MPCVRYYTNELYVWQSCVENEHYSVSVKNVFSASNNALGHCLRSSQLLLHMYVTGYGP